MEWLTNVKGRIKKKNLILFSKDNELLQELDLLIRQQSHRTLVLWALELAEESVVNLEQKYPTDFRPRRALETTKLWASGNVKMPVAKHEILNCHAMAKELTSLEDIALCHAIGQACGVVHAPGHALGYPMYELTALIRKHGVENCKEIIEERFDVYVEKLFNCAAQKELIRPWASFIKQ